MKKEQCLTAPGTAKRILDVLQSYGLPYECGLPLQELTDAIALDKKNLNNLLNVVLLREIGSSYIHPTTLDFFKKILETYSMEEYIMKLEGKIAIVTGAGKGIGREAALAIAEEGATVVAVARTQADLDETVKMIEEKGGKAVSLSRDLTDGQQVQSMVDTVVEKYGRIDILVNNAGGYPSEIYDKVKKQAIKIWEWTEAQWDQIIKTNLRIPFLCINKVVPVMIKQGGGDIVSVSSRMGRIASQMGAYAVAKGGIITLTKTTAIQTQEYGIKVNAVSPGIVDTPGQRVYNHNVGQDDIKMGSAQDVAKAIRYLLCDSPAVMTGQSIDLFTTV